MFFTSIKANRNAIEETFNLKYDLRGLLRRSFPDNRDLRHFVMGTVQGERQGSKIIMSRPYSNDNAIRIWGWIPEEVTRFGASREEVIQQLYSYLNTQCTMNYWREYNSIRDSIRQQYTEPKIFLESLLKGEK